MLPTDLSIALAQERIRDLLVEAETSRLAGWLRKRRRRHPSGRSTPSATHLRHRIVT